MARSRFAMLAALAFAAHATASAATPVKSGQRLTIDDFVPPTGSPLWRLRTEQDETFGGGGVAGVA